MKIPKITEAMTYLDDELIVAAAGERTQRRGWVKWAAACFCLAVLGAAAVKPGTMQRVYDSDGHVGADAGNPSPAVTQRAGTLIQIENSGGEIMLLHGVSGDEGCRFAIPAGNPLNLPSAEPKAGTTSREEAEKIAYLDMDAASPEMRESIRRAREIIIYSEAWVADGYSAAIQDAETGEIIRTLPTFSELFPGWSLPVTDTGSVTEDGLGADCLYGLMLRVLRASGRELLCSVSEGMNGFTTGQTVTVLLPEDGAAFAAGDSVFAAFLGENCDVAGGSIQAASVEKR